MTEAPPFPLAPGHRYGQNPYDAQVHTGQDNANEYHSLMSWQREYAKHDRDMLPSGVFDGPTQRAAIAVQRACALTITAEVDADTWNALFGGLPTSEPASPVAPAPRPQGPVDLGKLAGVIDTSAMKRRRAIERAHASNTNKIIYRNRHKGQAPAWHGSEEATDTIRRILGMPPGKYTQQLQARVKGIQRAANIDQTGSVDVATAWLLDEMTPVVDSEVASVA